jgi:autotransporter-associated beta strand protein
VSTGSVFADLGPMNGTGSLTKTGDGTFVLGAAGNFSGGLTVSSGLVAVSASQALGSSAVTVSSGASLAFVNTGNYVGNNAITISGTGNATIGAALAFTGTNSFGGSITVGGNAGSLANIGFDANSNTTLTGMLTKDGRTLEFDAGGSNVNVTIGGALTGLSANSDVIFNGNNQSTANFTITAPQNYNGPTYVTNGSTLFLGASDVLPGNSTYPSNPRTDLTLTTSNPSFVSTFDLAGFSDTVRTLNSTDSYSQVTDSSATGSTLTVSPTATGYSTFAGQLTGNLSMVFAGAAGSAQVLTGASSYSGTTNINSGALIVNGSVTSGGTVTVNSGATNPGILAGIGTVTGNVVVAGDGTVAHNGVLSPGNTIPNLSNPGSTQAPGLLALAGNLTVNGTYLWDLTGSTNSATQAGVSYDQVGINGTLTVTSVSSQLPVFDVVLNTAATPTTSGSTAAFWSTQETWNVITGITATPTGSGFSLAYAEANSWSSFGQFTIGYSSGSEQLVWTPVPEPGSLLLAGLAAAGFGAHGWRRRRKAKRAAPTASEEVVS